MNKKQTATRLHEQNYNCAQAVACAFAEEAGMDKETLFRACEGLGLGMGCMEGTCGAITGAIVLAGFKNSDGETEKPGSKLSTYKLSREIMNRFAEKNKSTCCGELKGVGTGTVLRSCQGCIEDAVEIAADVLGYQEDE